MSFRTDAHIRRERICSKVLSLPDIMQEIARSGDVLAWNSEYEWYEVLDGEGFERQVNSMRPIRGKRKAEAADRPFARMHMHFELVRGGKWAGKGSAFRPKMEIGQSACKGHAERNSEIHGAHCTGEKIQQTQECAQVYFLEGEGKTQRIRVDSTEPPLESSIQVNALKPFTARLNPSCSMQFRGGDNRVPSLAIPRSRHRRSSGAPTPARGRMAPPAARCGAEGLGRPASRPPWRSSRGRGRRCGGMRSGGCTRWVPPLLAPPPVPHAATGMPQVLRRGGHPP